MNSAYAQGWADYIQARNLYDEEVLCLIIAAKEEGDKYYNEWLKGWRDAADQDDIES